MLEHQAKLSWDEHVLRDSNSDENTEDLCFLVMLNSQVKIKYQNLNSDLLMFRLNIFSAPSCLSIFKN